MRPARATFVLALVLCVAALAAYSAAPGFDFVALDDPDYVTANARVGAGLSLENAAWAFSAGHASNWHPLTWLSHMLDVEIFGLDPAGHHATSVLLHAANTLLVFLVLARLTGDGGKSAFVAALFGLHPLHVESVAWVSERKDVLSTLFFFLAAGAYASWARRGGAGRYAVTAALLALGLLAKPMVVTLPFVFLLLDWWPLGRWPGTPARKLLLEKAPFFALSLASAVVTYLVQAASGAVKGVEAIPLVARSANAAIAALRYLETAVWPRGLCVFYPHPSLPGGPGISGLAVAGAAVFLAAVSAAVLVAAKRGRREIAFGWLFFLGTLVPVIGIVQVGLQARADRYTYVPLFGVFVAATWGISALARRAGVPRAALSGAGAAVAVALLLATRAQAEHWRSSEALFERALAVTEANFPVHYEYGLALQHEGDPRSAAEQYRRALAIHPGDVQAANNLGAILRESGDIDAAMKLFETALRGRPDHALALANLGHCYAQLGDRDAAIERYERALAVDPGLEIARNALVPTLGARAFALATSRDAAARDGSRAVRLAARACELTGFREPGLLDVLAAAYAEAGRFDDAVAAAERAVSIAESIGAAAEAALFRTRLASYRAGAPLRQ